MPTEKERRMFGNLRKAMIVGRASNKRAHGDMPKKREKHLFDLVANKKPRKVDALSIFKSHNFCTLGDARMTLGQKNAALCQQWKALSDAEQAVYLGEAERRARGTAADATPLDIPAYIAQKAAGGGQSKKALRCREQRRAAGNTLQKIRYHDAWESGTGLFSFDATVKPNLISMASNETLKAKADTLFGYDATVLANPAGNMSKLYFTPCCLRFGGLCCNDEHQKQATAATYNLHLLLRRRDIAKKSLPVLLEVRAVAPVVPARPAAIEEATQHVFLCKMVGRGDLAICLQAVVSENSVAVGADDVDQTCVPVTFHMLVKSLLEKMKPANVTRLRVRRMRYSQGLNPVSWEASVGEELFADTLELDGKATERAPRRQAAAGIKLPFGFVYEGVQEDATAAKAAGKDDEEHSEDEEDRILRERLGEEDANADSATDSDIDMEGPREEELAPGPLVNEHPVEDPSTSGRASTPGVR